MKNTTTTTENTMKNFFFLAMVYRAEGWTGYLEEIEGTIEAENIESAEDLICQKYGTPEYFDELYKI